MVLPVSIAKRAEVQHALGENHLIQFMGHITGGKEFQHHECFLMRNIPASYSRLYELKTPHVDVNIGLPIPATGFIYLSKYITGRLGLRYLLAGSVVHIANI